MIRIEPLQRDTLERVYSLLKKPYRDITAELLEQLSQEEIEGDEWKRGKAEPVEIHHKVRIGMGPIELLSPLAVLQMFLRREDENYSFMAQIIAREPNAFTNRSRRFKENLEKRNLQFLQTSSNLTGYILDESDKERPVAVIMGDEMNSFRAIDMGKLGSRRTKIENSEDFTIAAGRMVHYVNSAIGAIYQKSKTLRNLDLSLSFPPV